MRLRKRLKIQRKSAAQARRRKSQRAKGIRTWQVPVVNGSRDE
jgi:hypothetical protein